MKVNSAKAALRTKRSAAPEARFRPQAGSALTLGSEPQIFGTLGNLNGVDDHHNRIDQYQG